MLRPSGVSSASEANSDASAICTPETPASGIGETGLFRACWYRRRFEAPDLVGGRRLVIHFGAVDHAATVWVNGRFAAAHEGGYCPF